MDSTPARRFAQNCSTVAAPGKRPAIPTTATASSQPGPACCFTSDIVSPAKVLLEVATAPHGRAPTLHLLLARLLRRRHFRRRALRQVLGQRAHGGIAEEHHHRNL